MPRFNSGQKPFVALWKSAIRYANGAEMCASPIRVKQHGRDNKAAAIAKGDDNAAAALLKICFAAVC